MVLELPAVGTRGLHSQEDLANYIAAFNRDDYAEYTRYYHKEFRMSIDAIPERSLRGFVNWATHTHLNEVSEEVNSLKQIFDRDGKFIVVDSVVKFRGRKGYYSENWGGVGPISEGTGPDIRMAIFYHLDPEGRVLEIEAVIAGPVPKAL